MEKLAEQLRKEIAKMSEENSKSFSSRREYVINEIRGGKREVFFTLAQSYSKLLKEPTKEMLKRIGVEDGYRAKTWDVGTRGMGIYYKNGKHYVNVVKQTDSFPRETIDEKVYCVEDEEGFWRTDYVYNREELLDLGAYFEREGFNVWINRCSDTDARLPYKMYFYNIESLIISL